MNQNFSSFIRDRMGGDEQKEFAARMGISASQLCKVLKGQTCKQQTVARIIAGISEDSDTQAECLAAYLRDFLPLGGPASTRVLVTTERGCLRPRDPTTV